MPRVSFVAHLALLSVLSACPGSKRDGASCTVFTDDTCEGEVAVVCSGANGERAITRTDCRARGKVCVVDGRNASCISAKANP
jgi:hypothetical protein